MELENTLMDVIIAEAGIGGLTAAVALHAASTGDASPYESAPELRCASPSVAVSTVSGRNGHEGEQ
ncbi:hypothetical protein LQ757_07220 [Agromyces sp. SYSU K20354]|uniref:hypothetical protein n=1 Tax=Agromyces cavernae TaxID=2898659 RepID=UPI001E5E8232|nr:hypothetical protein [Agromyces cavernae]MCD2442068.1 hypothetical protein [Agromyces cavernae]